MINFVSSNKGEKITVAIDFIRKYNDKNRNPEIANRLNKVDDILFERDGLEKQPR